MLILMTAKRLAPSGVKLIEDAGHELRLLQSENPDEELAAIMASEPVNALISRTIGIKAEHIASCPTLRIISRHGVGYDNVDIAAATASGIPVTIVDSANAQSVAELTIGLMFAAARQIPYMDYAIRQGEWDRSHTGIQLAGKRLGLVAYGAIGRAVARMAMAIGMSVSVYDPNAVRSEGVDWKDDLVTLLKDSDVLSLHAPLLPQTRGLIGAKELALLPKNALVINTARGGLLDEAALAAALASGHIAGAGIDTFEAEPLHTDHPFINQPRITMTPHMGGSTDVALDNVAISAVNNVLAVFNGEEPPRHLVVNPTVLKHSAA